MNRKNYKRAAIACGMIGAVTTFAEPLVHCVSKKKNFSLDLVPVLFAPTSAPDLHLVLNHSGKATTIGVKEVGGNELVAYYESVRGGAGKNRSRSASPAVRAEISEALDGISTLELDEPIDGLKGKLEMACDLYELDDPLAGEPTDGS